MNEFFCSTLCNTRTHPCYRYANRNRPVRAIRSSSKKAREKFSVPLSARLRSSLTFLFKSSRLFSANVRMHTRKRFRKDLFPPDYVFFFCTRDRCESHALRREYETNAYAHRYPSMRIYYVRHEVTSNRSSVMR